MQSKENDIDRSPIFTRVIAYSQHSLDEIILQLPKFQTKTIKELEQLAAKLLASSPPTCHTVSQASQNSSSTSFSTLLPPANYELFIAYGYLAQLHKRPKDAMQFAVRACQLASAGQQRAEAYLLRAQLLLEAKKPKEADAALQEALHNDSTHLDSVECWVRSLVGQKRYNEAHRLLRNAHQSLVGDGGGSAGSVGAGEGVEVNHRLHYLDALVMSEETGSAGGAVVSAIALLEHVVENSPGQLDALFLLVRLYEKLQTLERAIDLLQKHALVRGEGNG